MARQKSEEKYDAIMQATLTLVSTEGFHGISMAKIAKAAGVAPATIYTYFENKEAILNQMYLDLKELVAKDMLRGVKPYMTTKEGFKLIWRNFYDSILHHSREFDFLNQFTSSPFITQFSKEEGHRQFKPMKDFFARGMDKGDIKQMPLDLLLMYIHPPLNAMAQRVNMGHGQWSEAELALAVESTWRALAP